MSFYCHIEREGQVCFSSADAPSSGGGPGRVLVDWTGAHYGVASVAADGAAAVALLEKQLRQKGETEEVCRMVVHDLHRKDGMTEMAFSAIPLSVWQGMQRRIAASPETLLAFDWLGALIHWARIQKWQDGMLLCPASGVLDVLVFQKGRLVWMERIRRFGSDDAAMVKAVQRALGLIRAAEESSEFALTRPLQTGLLVPAGFEGSVAAVMEGLGADGISTVWAEQPAAIVGMPVGVPRVLLSWQALVSSLPLTSAINPRLEKLAVRAWCFVPVLGAVAFVLSVLLAAWAGTTHFSNAAALESDSRDRARVQGLSERLARQASESDQISARQAKSREWLRVLDAGLHSPDFVEMLEHIRDSVPPDVLVQEVGLVAGKGKHLITVTGRAMAIESALQKENEFAQALEKQGFTIEKRDLLVEEGQQKFKLSMMRGRR